MATDQDDFITIQYNVADDGDFYNRYDCDSCGYLPTESEKILLIFCSDEPTLVVFKFCADCVVEKLTN